jgi:hypothetical protein
MDDQSRTVFLYAGQDEAGVLSHVFESIIHIVKEEGPEWHVEVLDQGAGQKEQLGPNDVMLALNVVRYDPGSRVVRFLCGGLLGIGGVQIHVQGILRRVSGAEDIDLVRVGKYGYFGGRKDQLTKICAFHIAEGVVQRVTGKKDLNIAALELSRLGWMWGFLGLLLFLLAHARPDMLYGAYFLWGIGSICGLIALVMGYQRALSSRRKTGAAAAMMANAIALVACLSVDAAAYRPRRITAATPPASTTDRSNPPAAGNEAATTQPPTKKPRSQQWSPALVRSVNDLVSATCQIPPNDGRKRLPECDCNMALQLLTAFQENSCPVDELFPATILNDEPCGNLWKLARQATTADCASSFTTRDGGDRQLPASPR